MVCPIDRYASQLYTCGTATFRCEFLDLRTRRNKPGIGALLDTMQAPEDSLDAKGEIPVR